MALIFGLTILAIVIVVVGFWKVFEKAGEPGWAAIVPIYNYVILVRIAGKPAYWVIFMFIPYVNIVFLILIGLAVAKAFGKSQGFGIGLALLSPIFYPMLGFDDSVYQGNPLSSLEDQIDEIGR